MLTHTALGAAEESEWDLLAIFISGFALCINSEECERVVNIQFLRGRSTDRVCRFKRRQLYIFLRDGKKIRDVKLVVRDCSFSDDYRGEEVLTEAEDSRDYSRESISHGTLVGSCSTSDHHGGKNMFTKTENS